MAARFISNIGVVIDFPAKEKGKRLELSNIQTEEYTMCVFLTRWEDFREDCPQEVKDTMKNETPSTMVGFIRESDFTSDSWESNAHAYCVYKYSMVEI